MGPNLLQCSCNKRKLVHKHAQKEEKQSKQIPVAEDQNESDDLEDNKKIQHDVDYTTSVDEQGNVEMDEETNHLHLLEYCPKVAHCLA